MSPQFLARIPLISLLWLPCAYSSVCWAQETEPTASTTERTVKDAPDPYPVNAGARVMMLPIGIDAGYGLGLEGSWSVLPRLAVGAQANAFYVKQATEGAHCTKCVERGTFQLVFAEGRLWPEATMTPFARLGVGHAYLEGQGADAREYRESHVAFEWEMGPEFHYRFFSARAFVFQLLPIASPLNREPIIGYGTELGARF